MNDNKPMPIYLEIGTKKVFASAVDWPGWSRWGRDEEGAIQALLEAGPRYARVVKSSGLAFGEPAGVGQLEVSERVPGNSTTDFGAPDRPHSTDDNPVDNAERERLQAILEACWGTFERVVEAAQGKELRKGPRGGGRDLSQMVDHVTGAHESYLKQLGWRPEGNDMGPLGQRVDRLRQASIDGLAAGVAGKLPAEGPRGGKRWSPRYFVRRAAWHILDHVWEIEDRLV